jgi:hypothetical protein
MDIVREPYQGDMKRVVACTIIGLSLLLPFGHGLAEEQHTGASLELRLGVEKTNLLLGEPVYATVRLINVGTMAVEVFKALDPQTGDVHIEVSSPNRPRFVFLPLFYADAVDARKPLAPGEEVAAAFPFFYGALGWTFRQPGTYSVTAGYRDSARTHHRPVRSNSVTVTVADESGLGAFLMNDSSASDEAGKFLLWQRGDHLQAGHALLTNLLKTFPNSPVADYVLLAFGRNLSRSFRNYAIGRIRQPDCAAALGYFQKVRPDRLPAFLQIQKNLDEARCLIKMSQPIRAGESMNRAQQLGGGRNEFRPLFQQAARLEPALKQAP